MSALTVPGRMEADCTESPREGIGSPGRGSHGAGDRSQEAAAAADAGWELDGPSDEAPLPADPLPAESPPEVEPVEAVAELDSLEELLDPEATEVAEAAESVE